VRQTGQVTYAYDGEGRRVRKSTKSGTVLIEQVTYVYDAAGQLGAEYTTTKPPESSPCFGNPAAVVGAGTLCFLTADHLGTTRVVTNGLGGVVSRMDFRPFGEQIAVVGGTPRVNVAGYSTDSGVSLKFTGQVRDASMQDYFGARYFSGYQGRFTSPDEPLLDQNPEDPQSWNLYSYVRNNPLIFVDPSGNDCVYLNSSGSDVGTIDSKNSPAQCGKTGGYWVDGTVTNATFAHGSLSLTGTTNGENRTSASYGLGPDPGLLALQRGALLAEPGVKLAAASTAAVMGGASAGMAYSAWTGGSALAPGWFNALQGHHAIPRFLGGNFRQTLSSIPRGIHQQFHARLRQELKRAGIPLNVGGRGGSIADLRRTICEQIPAHRRLLLRR